MSEPATQPETLRDLLERLSGVKSRFEPGDRQTKVALLRALKDQEIRQADSLIAFHEALCFLRAYPDSPEVLRLVEQALRGFPARVDRIRDGGSPSELKRLRDTGMAHTTTYYPYPHPIAKWLVRHFPRDVEMDWEDEEGIEKVRAVLPLLTLAAESGTLDDEGVSTRDWVRAAKGARRVSDLRWLLELLERSPLPREVIRHLYESAELLVGWELRDATASRTQAKLPVGRVFYHQDLVKLSGNEFRQEIRKALPGLKPAPPKAAQEVIQVFRSALAARNRELHPLSYANPRDVFAADVGRGLRIALIGVAPEMRLPLEAYYSFLVLKNGVPVGYGGGASLFDRLEIAGNIFESFRQGESVYIFSQVYRAFRHLCGSGVFLLPRYQIGYENAEAIQSGAFWFYHKLGFRPVHPDIFALSEEEQGRIKADPSHRSSPATLEQLAESDMFLSLEDEGGTVGRNLRLGNIGLLVAQGIARGFGGSRTAAVQGAAQQVASALGVPRWRSWPGPERLALERLSPILVLVPDLARWAPTEKRALVRIIRAKGGRREAEYIRLLRRHQRLARSLGALSDPAVPFQRAPLGVRSSAGDPPVPGIRQRGRPGDHPPASRKP